jgi:hypothetical protein
MSLATEKKVRGGYVYSVVVLRMGRGGNLIEMFFEL